MNLTKEQRRFYAKTVLKLKKDYGRDPHSLFGEKSHWKMKHNGESFRLDYNDLTWSGKQKPLIWRTDSYNLKEEIAKLDGVLFDKFLEHMAKGIQMATTDQMKSSMGVKTKEFLSKFLLD